MKETKIMDRKNLDGTSSVYLGAMIPMVRNQAIRYCDVVKVTGMYVDFEWEIERTGNQFSSHIRYNDLAALLPMSFINRIVRDRTAFNTMDEMVNAAGGYRPTIMARDAWDRVMIVKYGQIQFARGDSRTTYSGDEFPNRSAGDPLPSAPWSNWDTHVPTEREMAAAEIAAEKAEFFATQKAEAEYYERR